MKLITRTCTLKHFAGNKKLVKYLAKQREVKAKTIVLSTSNNRFYHEVSYVIVARGDDEKINELEKLV